MLPFAILQTKRLTLRHLRIEDAPQVLANFSFDEVTKFYDLATFTELAQAEQLIANWIKRSEQGQGLRWAITLTGDDTLIGTCGFHNLSAENRRAEIGYELHPDYWRQGIMTEAVQALLAHGFAALNLHRIEAFIDPAHHASYGLLVRCGFQSEGVLRDYFFEKGRFVDAQMLSILQREFVR